MLKSLKLPPLTFEGKQDGDDGLFHFLYPMETVILFANLAQNP